MFVAPRYGTGSLADLMPAVLAALGVPGAEDRLGLDVTADRICVLLVDGLGADALTDSAAAPFLSGLRAATLTAGFPTTTVTSLGCLTVGVPPGQHGFVGYLLDLPGLDGLFDPLAWRLHGRPEGPDLQSRLVPEEFQPLPTVFERAAADGVAVTQVSPRYHRGSGLTRALFRGCGFRAQVSFGDLVTSVGEALRAGPRALVYAYHGELDLTGHVRGPSSPAWRAELAHVDRLAAALAEQLPPGAVLVVTADHGMVELTERIDFDTTPALQEGVRALGGEPRARHVYTHAGAVQDVAAAWQAVLGAEFTVLPREEAVRNGWFGPAVAPLVAERIGDLVVLAGGHGGVIRSGAEPVQSKLVGHHGSLTPVETHVPLCVLRT